MTPLATAGAIEALGMLSLAGLTAGWLLARGARLRWVLALMLLVAAPLVLAGSVIGDETSSLPSLGPLQIVAAIVLATGVLAATAAVFVRWPRAVMPAALATLAFRVPLVVGGETVKLLLPLYLVIGGAVAARAWVALRRSPTAEQPRALRLLDVAIAVYLGLYALQSLYAGDPSVAAQNFCFFYAPFALLYGLAVRQEWDAKLLRACGVTLVGVAVVLVLLGFVEFSQKSYLITIGGTQPSDFDPYFRVQSLFFDPNIYGRFLAVVMIVVTAVMLWTGRSRRVLGAALLLTLLWAGLVLSLSQSSFAALLAGLVVLAALRWRAKPVLLTTGAVLLAGFVLVLALPSVSGIDLGDGKAETTTSGRFDLVSGALTLAGNRPLQGYGSGDFSRAYRANDLARRSAYGPTVTTKSHTTPLTVLAEQGVIGLASFLLLLVAGFGAVFRRVRQDDGPNGRPGLTARVAVAAAFTALFVHTLAYAAFLEDPLTWVLLGCAVSLAAIPRRAAGEPSGVAEGAEPADESEVPS